MSGAVAGAALAGVGTLALGWSVWRAQHRTRPRSGADALLGHVFAGPVRSIVPSSLRRLTRGHGIGDPVHLLRFRTAIERGASVVQAFESMAAGSGRWAVGARRLVRRVAAGASVQEALDLWVGEDGDASIRLLADALAISASTGGSHLRAVDAVIDATRERASLQREVRALASQAHTSALVLVVMPIGFALAVAVADARIRAFYLGSALGPVCVVGGCLLDAAGAWLMLRMVRSVA